MSRTQSWVAALLGAALAAGVALAAPMPTAQARVLAITLFAIVAWIAAPVPPWVTGLAAIGLIGVAQTPALALSGFGSPATWLIVFGLVVGEATRRSGLATATQTFVFRHLDVAGADPRGLYYRLLALLCAVALAFALLLPAALVRVLIAIPVLVAIGTVFEDRRPRLGVFFAPLFATYYGASGILTANLPNVIITGIVESVAGVSITWSEWFVSLFPVMSLARVLLIFAVVGVLYRPSPDAALSPPSAADGETGDARRMLCLLFVGVAFWASDAVHGLHPMFGALLVAVLALLPRVGVMDYGAVEDVDFSVVFFVGAVFAISAALAETGFTETAANALLRFIPADAPSAVVLGCVFFVTLALTFVIEGVAVSSVLTPILVTFAASAGIPVDHVAYVEASALATFFFPYQSAVLVVILRADLVETRDVIRTASLLSIATVLVLLPAEIGYLTL
ncbi:SLC13 family permease [Halarchaeum nitratireducens]|uniref:Sodium:sulfate symporter n=1 Tax=Halarchaeum nitratireducens TaxID=489913 RepID=A0A830G890_9EURY|nr:MULTISPECIES: SLC13 family permease [Halarchaeum]MBP2249837.1 anion transporter [Halarchaeum solikamskense]GGN10263.1 hypothetical protein GCM10009021_07560 [Halarchaeum nitratireducens]